MIFAVTMGELTIFADLKALAGLSALADLSALAGLRALADLSALAGESLLAVVARLALESSAEAGAATLRVAFDVDEDAELLLIRDFFVIAISESPRKFELNCLTPTSMQLQRQTGSCHENPKAALQ
jgi:hypothetical protein